MWKGLSKARVSPLLIDLESQDITQPLARFTATLPNEQDMWKILKMINSADPEKELPEQQLRRFFDRVWPEFEKEFHKLREVHKKEAKPAPRALDDMVVEILNITRGLQRNSEEIMQKLPKTVNVLGVSGSDYLAAFGDKPVLEKRALAYYFDTFLKHAKDLEKRESGEQLKKPIQKPPEKPVDKPPEKPPDKSA